MVATTKSDVSNPGIRLGPYYRRVASTGWQHTWAYVRARGWRIAGAWFLTATIGLLIFALLAGTQAARGQLIEVVAFGLVPGTLYLLWTLLLNIITAPAYLSREEKHERELLLSNLREYERTHSPLELITATSLREPTVIEASAPTSQGKVVRQYLVRVAVRNAGYNPVDGVRVLLESVSPWHELFRNKPLRFVHDQSPDAETSRTGITLQPKEQAFIALIRIGVDSDGVAFCVASSELMQIERRINFTVHLVAQGNDVKPYHQRFALLLEGREPELLPIG